MKAIKSSALHQNCEPISVNCVMWDGSDLCCITLCKGDSAKDIIFKLAKKMCVHDTQLDMSGLNLRCLSVCNPAPCTFELLDVLQAIIDRLAACCCDEPSPDSSGRYVPPTYTIPASLRYVDENGDTVDTLGGEDYLELVGQAAGTLTDRANATDIEFAAQSARIDTIVDNIPPEYTPPTVQAPVVMGDSAEYQMPVVIEATDEYLGDLLETTGTNSQILTAIGLQGSVGTAAAFSINGIVSSLPNWVASPTKLADFITNAWVYMKDLRFGVAQALEQSAITCNSIIFDYTLAFSSDAKTLYVYVRGYSTLPAGFEDDSPSGQIKLVDSAGSQYTDSFSFETAMASPFVAVDLTSSGLAIGASLTATINVAVTNGDLSCAKQTVKSIENGYVICPEIALSATSTVVTYIFNPPVENNVVYTIDLLDGLTLAVLQTDTITNPTGVTTGTFTGLTTATAYKVRATVSITTMPSVICSPFDITTA